MKKIVRVLLLAFVAASLAYLVADEIKGRSASGVDEPSLRSDGPSGRMIRVYYFHGNMRCATCRSIEAYAREAVETGFPEELRSGRLEWKTVNVDAPGGDTYVQMFRLTTRSVVLEEIKGDTQTRWKNLDRVWELVRNQPVFITYVQEETRAFLGAGPE